MTEETKYDLKLGASLAFVFFLLALAVGCSTVPPITPMSIYQDCVNDLKHTAAWNRIFEPPLQEGWEMKARALDIEWKQMCMAGAKGEPQQAQADRLEMGQHLILGNQYIEQMRQMNQGRMY